jgi:hypothetical protein
VTKKRRLDRPSAASDGRSLPTPTASSVLKILRVTILTLRVQTSGCENLMSAALVLSKRSTSGPVALTVTRARTSNSRPVKQSRATTRPPDSGSHATEHIHVTGDDRPQSQASFRHRMSTDWHRASARHTNRRRRSDRTVKFGDETKPADLADLSAADAMTRYVLVMAARCCEKAQSRASHRPRRAVARSDHGRGRTRCPAARSHALRGNRFGDPRQPKC